MAGTSSSTALSPAQLESMFSLCDVDGKGWLSVQDLRHVSPELSDKDLDYIFRQLDGDRDNKISKSEFMSSFASVLARGETHGFGGVTRRASITVAKSDSKRHRSSSRPPLRSQKREESSKSRDLPEIVYDSEVSDARLQQFSCQDDVLALYEHLQQANMPQLMSQFEKVIGTFMGEIGEQKEHNELLQKKFTKERMYHQQTMSEVEADLEKHIQTAAEKAKQEERQKLEVEKQKEREKLESEINELRSNIQRLQKMETAMAAETDKTKIEDIKNKLQNYEGENRHLKHDLTEKQIEMTLIKAELSQLRHEYDDRLVDLQSEKEDLIVTLGQQGTVSRQLQLLYDANRKLHDTNDNLREALDQRGTIMRQCNMRTPSPATTPRRMMSLAGVRPNSLSVSRGNYTDDDIDSGVARDYAGPIDSEGNISSETDIENHTRHGRLLDLTHTPSVQTPPPSFSAMTRTKSISKVTTPSHSNTTPERTFRVVMAGDASVGKSSLILRMVNNVFEENLPSTLGVDFHVKVFNIMQKGVALQLWDTAGQERFRSLSKSYFRRADGAILVYDCTSESSFLSVREWIEVVQEATNKPIPVVICANKTDARVKATAERRPCVSTEDGQQLAKSYGAIFVETSAKTGDNVTAVAEDMIKRMLEAEDSELQNSSVVLTNKKADEKSSCIGKKTCSA